MIIPGLLTASTNKADHLGTSGAGLEWCCIGSVLLSLRVVLVFGLKEQEFSPFVATLGHGWVLDRHRHCRNGVEDSEALRRVVGRAPVAQ